MRKIKGLVFGLAALMAAGVPAAGVYAAPANFGSPAIVSQKELSDDCSDPKTEVTFTNAAAVINFTVTEENKIEQAENVNDILALTLTPDTEYAVKVDGVDKVITTDGDYVYVDDMTLVEYVTECVQTTETAVDITIDTTLSKVLSGFKKAYSVAMGDMDYSVVVGDVTFKNLFYAAGVFETDLNDETEVIFTYEDGTLVFDGDYVDALSGLGEGATVELIGGHDIQPVEVKECSPYEAGEIAHYDCTKCGKHFADEKGNEELTDDQVFVYPFAAEEVGAIGEYDGVYYAVGEGRVCDSSKNGAVCGFVDDQKGWHIAKNGIVNLDFKGFATVGSSEMYFQKGSIAKKLTGAVQGTPTGKSKGTYYVSKGRLNETYKGFAKVGSSWYLFAKGTINKSKTGAVSGVIDGKKNWYYVKSGKFINTFKGIQKVGSSQYFFKNGTMDKTYNGTFKSGSTTYVIKAGKVVGTK